MGKQEGISAAAAQSPVYDPPPPYAPAASAPPEYAPHPTAPPPTAPQTRYIDWNSLPATRELQCYELTRVRLAWSNASFAASAATAGATIFCANFLIARASTILRATGMFGLLSVAFLITGVVLRMMKSHELDPDLRLAKKHELQELMIERKPLPTLDDLNKLVKQKILTENEVQALLYEDILAPGTFETFVAKHDKNEYGQYKSAEKVLRSLDAENKAAIKDKWIVWLFNSPNQTLDQAMRSSAANGIPLTLQEIAPSFLNNNLRHLWNTTYEAFAERNPPETFQYAAPDLLLALVRKFAAHVAEKKPTKVNLPLTFHALIARPELNQYPDLCAKLREAFLSLPYSALNDPSYATERDFFKVEMKEVLLERWKDKPLQEIIKDSADDLFLSLQTGLFTVEDFRPKAAELMQTLTVKEILKLDRRLFSCDLLPIAALKDKFEEEIKNVSTFDELLTYPDLIFTDNLCTAALPKVVSLAVAYLKANPREFIAQSKNPVSRSESAQSILTYKLLPAAEREKLTQATGEANQKETELNQEKNKLDAQLQQNIERLLQEKLLALDSKKEELKLEKLQQAFNDASTRTTELKRVYEESRAQQETINVRLDGLTRVSQAEAESLQGVTKQIEALGREMATYQSSGTLNAQIADQKTQIVVLKQKRETALSNPRLKELREGIGFLKQMHSEATQKNAELQIVMDLSAKLSLFQSDPEITDASSREAHDGVRNCKALYKAAQEQVEIMASRKSALEADLRIIEKTKAIGITAYKQRLLDEKQVLEQQLNTPTQGFRSAFRQVDSAETNATRLEDINRELNDIINVQQELERKSEEDLRAELAELKSNFDRAKAFAASEQGKLREANARLERIKGKQVAITKLQDELARAAPPSIKKLIDVEAISREIEVNETVLNSEEAQLNASYDKAKQPLQAKLEQYESLRETVLSLESEFAALISSKEKQEAALQAIAASLSQVTAQLEAVTQTIVSQEEPLKAAKASLKQAQTAVTDAVTDFDAYQTAAEKTFADRKEQIEAADIATRKQLNARFMQGIKTIEDRLVANLQLL